MTDLPTHQGNWNFPTPIRFGVGAIAGLGEACQALGSHNPLIVTDPGLALLPPVGAAQEACEAVGLGWGLFSDMRGNPVGEDVEAGVQAYRRGGHDGVVALGGGSAMDVGKAVGLMVGQDRPLWDFEDLDDWWTRVDVQGMAPVVAVPTTSGTGSEVGRCSVIVDTREHRKVVIFHPRMLPGKVVCDPALTVGLPPAITAAVGMDALSHNLEAFCAPGFHPMADGIAVEGIRRIHRSLIRAFEVGTDLEARADMMVASTMGATAFQKGLGAMHALSHPIGAELDTHHGLTNAVVMPYVLIFNREAIADRITVLARSLGIAPGFDGFLEWILALRQTLGIPPRLDALGFEKKHAALLAPRAAVDPTAATNPIPLSPRSLESLYEKALAGDLSP